MALILLALVLPRVFPFIELFSSQGVFYDIYYGGLGLDSRLSHILAVSTALISVIASSFIYTWGFAKLVWSGGTPSNIAQGLVACLATFAAPQIISYAGESIAGEACFQQGSGEVQKWYVFDRSGKIVISDTPGVDDRGRKRRPITPDICDIYFDQIAGRFPRPVLYLPDQTILFDPLSGQPKAWYSIDDSGQILLFDYPGFDPSTRQVLKPVDLAIEARLKRQYQSSEGPILKDWALGITRASASNRFLDARSIDYLLNRINACWSPPAGHRGYGQSIEMLFSLNMNGEIGAKPKFISSINDPAAKEIAQAMAEALVQCAPYQNLPRDQFSSWHELKLNAFIATNEVGASNPLKIMPTGGQ